jgi:hypothetical protein
MSQEIQIGTILMSEWPPLFGLASEPYSGRWSVLKAIDGFALDRKIRAAGWNFFLLASEVKVMFRGLPGARKMQHAVNRILGKVSKEHFNGVEITRIVTKRFLGFRYSIVSAHSRHVQQSCFMDGAEVRRDAEWSRR